MRCYSLRFDVSQIGVGGIESLIRKNGAVFIIDPIIYCKHTASHRVLIDVSHSLYLGSATVFGRSGESIRLVVSVNKNSVSSITKLDVPNDATKGPMSKSSSAGKTPDMTGISGLVLLGEWLCSRTPVVLKPVGLRLGWSQDSASAEPCILGSCDRTTQSIFLIFHFSEICAPITRAI